MRWVGILFAGAILTTASVGRAGVGFTLEFGTGWSSSSYRTVGASVEELGLDATIPICGIFSLDPWVAIAAPLTAQVDPSATSWYLPLEGGLRLGFVLVSSWTLFVGPMVQGLVPENRVGCGACQARETVLTLGANAEVMYSPIPAVSIGLEARWAENATALNASTGAGNINDSSVLLAIRLLNLFW